MSKNMTRKGLALGTSAVLVAAGFAALPASANGIANDYVVLIDKQEYENYNMLSTGYIEIDGSFAAAAQLGAGAELKFHVQDPSAISVFDVVPENATADSLASALTINKILVKNDSNGDLVSLGFTSAPGIEAGDGLSTPTDITVPSNNLTSAQLTSLNGNLQVDTIRTVSAITIGDSGTNEIVFGAAGSGVGDLETVTMLAGASHGILAGDLVSVGSFTPGDFEDSGGTALVADLTGLFEVTGVGATTISFDAEVGAEAGATFITVDTKDYTLAVHNLKINAGTAFASSDVAAFTPSAGTVTELTDGDAMDTVENLRIAKFGAAGVVGVATSRSTTSATINNYVVDTNEEDATAGNQTVRFAAASDTTTGSITVRGWIDNDDDGVIDAVEYVSDPLVITFVAPSSVTYTITAGDLYIGTGTGIEGRVTADLNLDEVGTQSLLTIDSVLIDASAGAEDPSSQGAQTLAFDATNLWLDAAITVDQAIATGDSVRFQVKSSGTNVGAAQTFGVGSLTVAGSTMSVSATTNNTRVSVKDADGVSMSGGTVKVRKGTATVSGVYTAWDGNPTDTTTDKVVPNVPFTMSITSSSVTAADGVKLNGKTVDGGTETVLGSTDANGQIAITLTQTAADASDSVTVSIDVQGLSASGVVTFTYEGTNYEVYDAFGEVSSSADYNATMSIGGTFTRDYIVADQFGVAPANGTAVITAARSGTRTDTAATWAYQLPVVDGKVKLTITDNGKGTGSDTVTVTAYPLAAGGGLDSSDDTTQFTLTYASTVTDVTAAQVTASVNYDGVDDGATDDKPIALEPDALVGHDARATGGKNPPSYETYNVDHDGDGDFTDAGSAQLTLSGTVTNAAGGLIPGAIVTIKATGAGFKFTTAGSKAVYAAGEITVRANAAGAYSVDVYGGTGGSKSFTVTAGAATAAKSVVFVAGGTIKDFTVTVPATSEPGRTADVLVTAKDASGNPVEAASVTLSSTGPGYLINTSGSTLSDGTFSTKLLIGSNDSGTSTIRVTMTIAGVATTKTATISVGAVEPVAKVGSFSGRVAIRVENAKGSTVSVKLGKSWYKYVALNNNYLQSWKSRKGTTVAVSVYVDGDLQNVQTITVK